MLSKAQIIQIQKVFKRDDERLPIIFNALSDSRRLKMFQILGSQKNLCVTELSKICNISVPAASQQLRILELSGLIRPQRNGQMICYQIRNKDPLIRTISSLCDI